MSKVLLSERLEQARRRRFVGRTAELDLFRQALHEDDLPFYVLHIFGPGGVGKTTLLREYAQLARQTEALVVLLDGRHLEATPDDFLASLGQGLGLGPDTDPIQYLGTQAGKIVLLLDTFELVNPLDGWLRDTFLPQLPANVLTVTAGRQPPSIAWRTDPGWQAMMRILPLRNLSPAESRTYLQRRRVPDEQHEAVLNFTHGHALALSLVADVLDQQPGTIFRPEIAPDVIKTLLEQLLHQVPSPAHRAALEASALVRLTTESLLEELLDTHDTHELFEWLRALSFIDADRRGIYPHDLAREALAADVRWRNPDWYAKLHERARNYYMRRVQHSNSQEQRRVLSDYIYLHRDNPAVRSYFEWQETGTVFTDSYRPEDQAVILEMVNRHEGAESAALAALWLQHSPEAFTIVRRATGDIEGFATCLQLEKLTAENRRQDPAVERAWEYLDHRAPLRPGETVAYFRFWMAHDTYQDVSSIQSRLFLIIVQSFLTTPGLAYTLLTCANPTFWQPVFSYADLHPIPEASFEVGRPYTVFGHDWRVLPQVTWLELMAAREIGGDMSHIPATTADSVLVLSQSDFATAVRDGLRDFANLNALGSNPLLHSRLILTRAAEDSPDGRVATLRTLLQETAGSLQESPRLLKLYRALYHTYFHPAATQEQAAELLDLPFSTYRRHLRSGIEYITERLWAFEIGDLEN